MDEGSRTSVLESIYKEISETMLIHQTHTLGLFPRGYTHHARVRDNVYCATALWALSLAYRHVGCDLGRTCELEQGAVKCMRGILFCYMRQAAKVEIFKQTQSWENALHARFDSLTGDPVTEDHGWRHLQIDGTAMFLLTLARMTDSGCEVVLTRDEVSFIQNLVYYIERAYRTPDFGMWERGKLEDISRKELHASSIGMAKAALDALDGMNLFGEEGPRDCIIHVDPDAQYRNYVILDTLLPKESSSKQTDAALLCVTGFPAFAIKDTRLVEETEKKMKQSLEGTHGFKRFCKDVHYTPMDKKWKKKFSPEELETFEGMECEWPIFFLYAFITECFRGNQSAAEHYWNKIESVLVMTESGNVIMPKLFYRPSSKRGHLSLTLGDEPKMLPLDLPFPFQWAQALYIIAKLLREKLISPVELDPLGLHKWATIGHSLRRHSSFSGSSGCMVQVALISETSRLAATLATYGIPTQTPKQIEPVTLSDPTEVLIKVYGQMGKNRKLGLSGRPPRPVGAIGTSKIYRIMGHLTVFHPTDLSIEDFYMSYDIKLFIDTVKSILIFLSTYWSLCGRPTVTVLLRDNLFKGGYFNDMLGFLADLRSGEVGGIKVRLDRLQSLIPTSCVENLEYLPDTEDTLPVAQPAPSRRSSRLPSSSSMSIYRSGSASSLATSEEDALQLSRFDTSPHPPEEEPSYGPADLHQESKDALLDRLEWERNYTGQLYILQEVMNRFGKDYIYQGESVYDTITQIYTDATTVKYWMAVRLGASLLKKVVDGLAPSLSSILVKEKEVTFGVFGYPERVVTEPIPPREILAILYDHCMPYEPVEAVLQQEMLRYLGELITRPSLRIVFQGMLRLRIGWIIQAMKNELREHDSSKVLYQLSPYEVKELLTDLLAEEYPTSNYLHKRRLDGALNRVPPNFYVKVYKVLEKIPGGIQVRGRTLPQRTTVITTSGHEKKFAILVEELFSDITCPEYRQLVVELLMVVSTLLERNPELHHYDCLNLDELLEAAFSLLHQDISENKVTVKVQGQSEDAFYSLASSGPNGSASYMAKATLNHLLRQGLEYDSANTCSVC